MVKPVKGGFGFLKGIFGQNKTTPDDQLQLIPKFKALLNDILPYIPEDNDTKNKINTFNNMNTEFFEPVFIEFKKIINGINFPTSVVPDENKPTQTLSRTDSKNTESPGGTTGQQQSTSPGGTPGQPPPTAGGKRRKSLKKGKKKCKKTKGRR